MRQVCECCTDECDREDERSCCQQAYAGNEEPLHRHMGGGADDCMG